jgi:hypothetical protein
MTDQQQGASDVAQMIRAFLDGSGRDWDWDDFTSCPLANPKLDSIRRRAGAVELPVGDEGRIALEGLAAEAERLARS